MSGNSSARGCQCTEQVPCYDTLALRGVILCIARSIQSAPAQPPAGEPAQWKAGIERPSRGVGLYDMQTGQEIARIKLAEWGHIVGFSPDSLTFLIGGSVFIIYNAENGEPIRNLRLLDNVSFCHDWDD